MSGTPGVTIGGTATGDGNIISANPTAGIGLYANTTGDLIEGNLIGTDISGMNPIGNGNGIQIDGGSFDNTIGGHGHRRGQHHRFFDRHRRGC